MRFLRVFVAVRYLSGVSALYVLIVSCATVAVAAAAVEAPLPSLWTDAATKLDMVIVKPPYAIVARPSRGPLFTRVDVVTLDPKTLNPVARSATSISCNRIHASTKGDLLCFTEGAPLRIGQFSTPASLLYSSDLTLVGKHVHQSSGRPDRARMSPDGKYGATTEFTTGHSYVGIGGSAFSTLTMLFSSAAPNAAENIQDWTVLDAGQKITSADLNLWGVTFDPSDSNRFFVTAYFNGKPHLAEGNVAARRMAIVKSGIECPSFSPDGKRLAFKKRTSATGWSPAVLDLATMQVTVFDVGNSVDDQIEWLSDDTLVYELVTRPLVGSPSSDLMSLNISEPNPKQRLWLAQARSPAFVRQR